MSLRTTVPVAWLLVAACAKNSVAPAPDPAEFMRGDWSYDRTPPVGDVPSLNTGLHVRIEIDSIKGYEFSGRVTLWLTGDVMIPPDVFVRVRGVVIEPRTVTLTIARVERAEPAILIEGAVTLDQLTIASCSSGENTGPFLAGAAFERGP